MSTPARIAALSNYIDATYPETLCGEAIARRRIDKLTEEIGEAVAAYGGMVGENPRKGVINGLDKVLYELRDVATCALGAHYHLARHLDPIDSLIAHVQHVFNRAGLQLDATDPTVLDEVASLRAAVLDIYDFMQNELEASPYEYPPSSYVGDAAGGRLVDRLAAARDAHATEDGRAS